jgi:hypothetical protein
LSKTAPGQSPATRRSNSPSGSLSLIVRDDATRGRSGNISSQVRCCRRECVDPASAIAATFGKESDAKAAARRRDDDARVGRIRWLVTCSSYLEGARGQAREPVRRCDSRDLTHFVVRRPERAARSRHAGDHGRRLVDLDSDRHRTGQSDTVCCRASHGDNEPLNRSDDTAVGASAFERPIPSAMATRERLAGAGYLHYAASTDQSDRHVVPKVGQELQTAIVFK